MEIRYVTFTGADDQTSIEKLVDVALDFPLAEWGILIGSSVKPRFPSTAWINEFAKAADENYLNVSIHVCKPWSVRLLLGNYIWPELPKPLVEAAGRVQINLGGQPYISKFGMLDAIELACFGEVIMQGDGTNDHLAYAMSSYDINASILYDMSGGRGVFPTSWPRPVRQLPCGYAGGIGPENVKQALSDISNACKHPFWIDMETGVRSTDEFDLVKVRIVLEQVYEAREKHRETGH